MKRWFLLAIAVVFIGFGAWMLVDALRHPSMAEPGQLWMALSILVMFGGAGVLFGYEIIADARRSRRVEPLGPADGSLVAIYSSTWLAIAIGGSLAFALAGCFMLRAGLSGGAVPLIVVGSLAAVVFGGFAVVGMAQLRRRGWRTRRIRIDAAGIRDSRIGDRLIAWDKIALISCRTLYGQRLIEVRLKEPSPYVANIGGLQKQLARLNLAFGFAPYAITLTGLSVGEADIRAAIDRFRPATLSLLDDDALSGA